QEVLGMTPTDYTRGADRLQISYVVAPRSSGCILVAWTNRGICALLTGTNDRSLVRALRAEFSKAVFVPAKATSEWIAAIRSGEVEDPLLARLPDPVRRDAFRARALRLLREVHHTRRLRAGT